VKARCPSSRSHHFLAAAILLIDAMTKAWAALRLPEAIYALSFVTHGWYGGAGIGYACRVTGLIAAVVVTHHLQSEAENPSHKSADHVPHA
jgi:hypothetical protein